MKYWHATLFASIFLTAFTNNTFWAMVVSRLNGSADTLFLLSLFVVLILLIHSLLSLLSFSWLLKPVLILLLLISATAAYFMDQHTVMVNKEVMLNVFKTDADIADELFNLNFLFKLILLGVLPAYLVYRIPVIYPSSVWQGLWERTLMFGLSSGVAVLIVLMLHQDYAGFARNNRDLRYFINPLNYLYSLNAALLHSQENNSLKVGPIEKNARLKRNLNDWAKPARKL